jgi:hypothetical protein
LNRNEIASGQFLILVDRETFVKKRLSLALVVLAAAAVLVAALAFKFGPQKLYAKLTHPRWVLELSAAMLIKMGEESQRNNISVGIDPTA